MSVQSREVRFHMLRVAGGGCDNRDIIYVDGLLCKLLCMLLRQTFVKKFFDVSCLVYCPAELCMDERSEVMNRGTEL